MRLSKIGLVVAAAFASVPALGGITQYNDRTTFEAQLGSSFTDGFDADPYFHGDIIDTATLDIHSDAQMSSIMGETDFHTTGFNNWNIIQSQTSNPSYCAGCNGSFELSFTTTSFGDASGVFGVGMDIRSNASNLPYHAFITLGDGTTIDVALPTGSSFWGVTSAQAVKSIHFGLANGGSTTNGSFVIDDLTIGSAVPSPGVLAFLSVAGFVRRRRRA